MSRHGYSEGRGPSLTSKLVSYIKTCRGDFTAASAAEAISGPGEKKKQKGGRKRLSDIEYIISSLHGIGYLSKKKKNSYRLNPDFACRGAIKVGGSGSAAIQLDDGFEVLVRKERTGNARTGDTVDFEFDDLIKGYFWARVTAVCTRARESQLARIDEARERGISLTLLDTPGKVRVRADRPGFDVNTGYYAFVSLLEEMTPQGQKCEIKEAFPPDDESYDPQRIIVKHGLPGPHREYRELKNADEVIAGELKGRKDYRGLYTLTIDGASAKDFDDAISLENEGRCHRLYVHIADVSAFVRKGSPLDREALERGNSYYIGGRVVPMLPETLSNDLCSLKAGEGRLTLTAEMLIDPAGKLREMAFHRGIIRVDRRLNYEEAHEILNSKGRDSAKKTLLKMDRLSILLKKMRMTRGRVDLNIPGEEIIYGPAGGISDIRFGARLSSHRIIEEFMLSANEAASITLREAGIPALYRIHEKIGEEKLTALAGFFRTIGMKFDRSPGIGLALQKVVDAVAGKEYEQVVNLIILRSFMQAFYGSEPAGHFGLGFRDYTHFTSPIRRYSDLIVHRCIKSLLEGTKPPYTLAALDTIGEKISALERLAMKAERDFFKLTSCRLMAGQVGRTFDVVVSSVSKYGLNVALMDRPVEGMVPMWTMTDDYYMVNEDEFTIVGKRLGRRFRIGDRLKAVLTGADIDTMRLDFAIR